MNCARNPSPVRRALPCAPMQNVLGSAARKPYNRSHMQPALHSSVPDASPAVFAVYGGKPHQGLAGENPAPHPGHEVCNFTVQLGMRGQAALDRLRLRCSGEQYDPDLGLYYLRARYYNPQTGRFMSRDPQDGDLTDPKTLHKYLYAGGDPVNAKDPTGRADLVEVAINVGQAAKDALAATVAIAAAACELKIAASTLQGLSVDATAPIENISFDFATCSAKVKRGKWSCSASCNLQGIGRNNPPFDRVFGWGTGGSEGEACVSAKRDATQKAPPGTYPRHCQCDCTKQ